LLRYLVIIIKVLLKVWVNLRYLIIISTKRLIWSYRLSDYLTIGKCSSNSLNWSKVLLKVIISWHILETLEEALVIWLVLIVLLRYSSLRLSLLLLTLLMNLLLLLLLRVLLIYLSKKLFWMIIALNFFSKVILTIRACHFTWITSSDFWKLFWASMTPELLWFESITSLFFTDILNIHFFIFWVNFNLVSIFFCYNFLLIFFK